MLSHSMNLWTGHIVCRINVENNLLGDKSAARLLELEDKIMKITSPCDMLVNLLRLLILLRIFLNKNKRK